VRLGEYPGEEQPEDMLVGDGGPVVWADGCCWICWWCCCCQGTVPGGESDCGTTCLTLERIYALRVSRERRGKIEESGLVRLHWIPWHCDAEHMVSVEWFSLDIHRDIYREIYIWGNASNVNG